MAFAFIMIAPLQPSHCGFSFVFGCGVSFLVGSSIFLLMVVQLLVVILVLSQEVVSTSPFYSTILNQSLDQCFLLIFCVDDMFTDVSEVLKSTTIIVNFFLFNIFSHVGAYIFTVVISYCCIDLFIII